MPGTPIHFEAKKDRTLLLVPLCAVLGSLILLLYPLLKPVGAFETRIVIGIALVTAFLPLWIWIGTSYTVGPDLVTYRFGPFRGRILIDHIREIQRHAGWSSALVRPVLSFDFLKIRCWNKKQGRSYEIPIAPKDEETFLEMIKARNPDIVITG